MKKKLLHLSLAILFAAAVLFGFFTTASPRSRENKTITSEFQYDWWNRNTRRSIGTVENCGIIKKECVEPFAGKPTYSITYLWRGSFDTFERWANHLPEYIPHQEFIQDYSPLKYYFQKNMMRYEHWYSPTYPPHIITYPCTKSVYNLVEVGDYADLTHSNNGCGDSGSITSVVKNRGPMIYHPDGLILWLYRDLPEE